MAPSRCWGEALRRLDLRPADGNHKVLRHGVDVWQISTAHFDSDAVRPASRWRREAKPLAEILVVGSSVASASLKRRLYSSGLKSRRCEMCGQDENWHGAQISLVLDHINGVRSPPTAGARTLTTRQSACAPGVRTPFVPWSRTQRDCSRSCGARHDNRLRGPRLGHRKVVRPPSEQLLRELAESNVCAVARRCGVSDNAVRTWLRAHEQEAQAQDE